MQLKDYQEIAIDDLLAKSKKLLRHDGEKTQGILANNHYGWFECVKRGTYTLTDEGQVSLREFPDLQARALNLLSES